MDTFGDSPESYMWRNTSPDLGGSTDVVHLYKSAHSTVGWKIFHFTYLLGYAM